MGITGCGRMVPWPSMDHYWCDIYFILETCAYRILGLTKLFSQHCQLPDMLPHQHLRALTNELTDLALPTTATPKRKGLLQLLQTRIQALLNPPPILLEQRVDNNAIVCKEEQRGINNTPILTIPRITEALPIMQSSNPTAKQTLKNIPRLHQQITWNNTPGIIPVPTLLPTIPPATQPIATYHPLPSGAHSCIVTFHAINALAAATESNRAMTSLLQTA